MARVKRRPGAAPRFTSIEPRGFTIIELMVTLAVAGILTALAVPAMRSFLQNDRLWTEQNALVMSLNAARSEAIKQDVAGGVVVCPSSDGATCNNTSAWSGGWIVLSSVAGSTPIQTVPALTTGNTLTEANNSTAVTFLPNGTVQTPAQFTFCDSRGPTQARYTEVVQFGRVASSPSSSLGTNLQGIAVTCP